MSSSYLVVLLSLVVLHTVVLSSEVIELDEDTFDAQVLEGDQNNKWILKFYAPWCGHCKTLAPKFEELATKVKDDATLKVGSVDCTQYSDTCKAFKVSGYPTLKVATGGKSYDFKGPRTVDSMYNFLTDTYVESAWATLPKASKKTPEEKEAERKEKARVAEIYRNSKVVGLDSNNIKSLVEDQSETPYFIKFMAPWCSHCKKMKLDFAMLSIHMDESPSLNSKAGEVDCTKHRRVCAAYGVKGFPTLIYVAPDGTKYLYENQPRIFDSFKEFVEGGYANLPAMEDVEESWSDAIMNGVMDWAGEHTLLAIFAACGVLVLFVGLLVMLLECCMGSEEEEDDKPKKD